MKTLTLITKGIKRTLITIILFICVFSTPILLVHIIWKELIGDIIKDIFLLIFETIKLIFLNFQEKNKWVFLLLNEFL